MTYSLLQTGIYSIPEASRLTHVSTWRIRRWLRGYEFKTKHGVQRSLAVWHSQLAPIDNRIALGFFDLLEVRCVDALITAGVTWKTLRQAHTKAQELFRHRHPFCTNKLMTDGQTIFMTLQEKNDEKTLWDMKDVQRVFDQIIQPFLKNVEFEQGEIPARWWPMGKDHRVALDPRRNFGQPSIFQDGIPTSVLARSVSANGSTEDSVEEVARWFEISPDSVLGALEFEKSLAA